MNEFTARGFDPDQITNEEYGILRQTVQDIYPNINLKQFRLSPAQTQIIVDKFMARVISYYEPSQRTQPIKAKLRFAKSSSADKQNRIPQDIERMKTAPKVMAGRTVKTSGMEGKRGVQEGVSAQTRAERLRMM